MFIEIPPKVDRILKTLEKAGFEAYAVGGCVRDRVLSDTPDDWDLPLLPAGAGKKPFSQNHRYRPAAWYSYGTS